MAEASLSEFFCPSILEFLASSDSSDQEFDSIVGSLPFDFELPLDPPIAPPPPSSTLDTASAANELQRLKDKNKNKNTERSTNTWAKRFTKWQEQKGIDVSVGKVSATEVDRVLQHFFAELKKQDGSDYEPDSLRTMLGALDRHFRNAGHEFRIIKDKEFVECRQVLNGKAIELREQGVRESERTKQILSQKRKRK